MRLKSNVLSPWFEWPQKTGAAWATWRVFWILRNGCLVVKFPGRLTFGEDCSSFLADLVEVEAVTFSTCPGMVKWCQHLEDHLWVVRPLLIALGLFTIMQIGFFVVEESEGRIKGEEATKQCNEHPTYRWPDNWKPWMASSISRKYPFQRLVLLDRDFQDSLSAQKACLCCLKDFQVTNT